MTEEKVATLIDEVANKKARNIRRKAPITSTNARNNRRRLAARKRNYRYAPARPMRRRAFAQRFKSITSFSFKKPMLDYLDLMVNPLDNNQICRMPDLTRRKSSSLIDYIRTQTFTASASTNTLANDNSAYGIILWFNWGTNRWNYNNSAYVEESKPYAIYYSIVNRDGLLTSVATGGDFIGVLPFVNSDKIMYPNPSITSETYTIAEEIRISSFGMRALPVIELATSNDVPYISRYISGFLQPNNVFEDFWGTGSENLNINELIQSFNVKLFQNSQGTCVRYNPFQSELARSFCTANDLTGTFTGSNFPTNYIKDYGALDMPFIFMNFSVPITPTSVVDNLAIFELPFYFDARLILEAKLTQPTPLISNPGPMDPDFNQISCVMNALPDSELPYITEGHSFKSFFSKVGKVIKFANTFLNTGQQVLTQGQQAMGVANQMYTSLAPQVSSI